MIHKVVRASLRPLFGKNVFSFAKEAAPKKDGRKDEKAAEPVAVV